MKLSALVATRNRPDTARRCIESLCNQTHAPDEIILLDWSEEEHRLNEQTLSDTVRVINSNKSYGVSEARNNLMERATGDIYFVIDDDAYLRDEDALQKLVDRFDREPDIGILAADIRDHTADGIEHLLPFSRTHLLLDPGLPRRFGRVSYFLGGGHAIRAEVVSDTGGYDPDLVYSTEELDLSIKAIESGYEIGYDPDIVVEHEPEPPVVQDHGEDDHSEFYYTIRSRVILLYLHYPLRYLAVQSVIWLSFYVLAAVRDGRIGELHRGVVDGIEQALDKQRSPFEDQTERYLKRNTGRLYF